MVSTCRSCHRRVLWVETEATEKKPGRRMPLDADDNGRALKSDEGNIVLVGTTGEGTPIARYVGKGPGKFVSHFATCPDAGKWRR